MPFMRVGEVAIHYRLCGNASRQPVVVAINSLGTDFRIWETVAEELAPHAAFLLYDKRGHGLSDLGALPQSIEDHAGDLERLLGALGIARVLLCGLSVGGLIALALHQRRPDLVAGVVFCDTAHRIGTAESWDARIAAVDAEGLAPLLDPVMERWFTPAYRVAENADYAGYRNMLARQSPQGYAATCAAIRDADYTQAARAITVPALCLVGDRDGATPPDVVRSLANLIPEAGFAVIADCGHLPCIEQPAALASHIRAFLAALTEGSSYV
ncbi:3-oxoadipate enol-lactonase [Azorhizobium oxalatiphilum]|uniref:3-oxoadipate enol-lactonase n=1 Tax=Azorhizobium oxalatiphilum TaxID=980631 RepID=UPI001668CDAE|nr:3-oxoadipate enol-lactonase [Azorhizobium oxalatiphilum]